MQALFYGWINACSYAFRVSKTPVYVQRPNALTQQGHLVLGPGPFRGGASLVGECWLCTEAIS